MSKKSILFYVLCALVLVIVARRSGAQSENIFRVAKNGTTSLIDGVRTSEGVWTQFKKDTIRIHDTIYIPVPVYHVLDTQAKVYISHDNKPVLKPCFIIWQGLKQQTPQGMQWINQPTIKAIYSKRWKLIPEKKIQKIL